MTSEDIKHQFINRFGMIVQELLRVEVDVLAVRPNGLLVSVDVKIY